MVCRCVLLNRRNKLYTWPSLVRLYLIYGRYSNTNHSVAPISMLKLRWNLRNSCWIDEKNIFTIIDSRNQLWMIFLAIKQKSVLFIYIINELYSTFYSYTWIMILETFPYSHNINCDTFRNDMDNIVFYK